MCLAATQGGSVSSEPDTNPHSTFWAPVGGVQWGGGGPWGAWGAAGLGSRVPQQTYLKMMLSSH